MAHRPISKTLKTLLAGLSLGLACATNAQAQGVFPEGKSTLFMGHSYFSRVAEAFEEIVDPELYPNHRAQRVFSGGATGSPEELYLDEEDRGEIERILDVGDIELLAMTVHSDQSEGTYYYEYWINYALDKNPSAKIFIAMPWVTNGPRKELATFRAENDAEALEFFETVRELRRIYGDRTEIYFIAYGNVMAELWAEFDANGLPAVEYFDAQAQCQVVQEEAGNPDPFSTCRDKNERQPFAEDSLFIDSFGHSGPMGYHTAAMVWFYYLYEDTAYLDFIDERFGTAQVLDAGTAVVRENSYAFHPYSW